MDCGGKRSATPLWIRPTALNYPDDTPLTCYLAILVVFPKALSPLRSASALQKLPPFQADASPGI
jgi:hypothetical protein